MNSVLKRRHHITISHLLIKMFINLIGNSLIYNFLRITGYYVIPAF